MLEQAEMWGYRLYEWTAVFGAALLLLELSADLVGPRLSGRRLLDTLASLSTQIHYYFAELAVFSASIVLYYLAYTYVTPYQIPVNGLTVALAVIAADFVYYWEHRLAHRVRLLWVSHAVHHSSRIMNTSVAFRFGMFEGVWAALMHLPLVLIGFDPVLVIFGELAVLGYQTWIHNELIGRLGPLEGILNTPSNHRVHHGCDEIYLDKNYGGILIVWDRIFGTYQAEIERPRYGLDRDFDSVNPLLVWFSEFPALIRDLRRARSLKVWRGHLFGRPDWRPDDLTQE